VSARRVGHRAQGDREGGQFSGRRTGLHDEVNSSVIGAIANVIAQVQMRGEICARDPRLYAFSVMDPLILAFLIKEVFGFLSD
jgi:hypothetical protein